MRDFVCARGIELPEAQPDSPADEWSVHGIANGKQALVEEALAREPVAASRARCGGCNTCGRRASVPRARALDGGEPVGEEPPPAA